MDMDKKSKWPTVAKLARTDVGEEAPSNKAQYFAVKCCFIPRGHRVLVIHSRETTTRYFWHYETWKKLTENNKKNHDWREVTTKCPSVLCVERFVRKCTHTDEGLSPKRSCFKCFGISLQFSAFHVSKRELLYQVSSVTRGIATLVLPHNEQRILLQFFLSVENKLAYIKTSVQPELLPLYSDFAGS